MQVFKSYIKITLKLWPMIVLTAGIMIGVTVMATAHLTPNQDFESTKPAVAIFDHDDSELSRGLAKYIASQTSVVEIDDSDEARKEAIYFQTVYYVFMIPDGFGADFVAGKQPKIESLTSQGGYAMQAKLLADNYLRLAEPQALTGASQANIAESVDQSLDQVSEIKVTNSKISSHELWKATYYFNFSTYAILASALTVIGNIMVNFNRRTIKYRNAVSATPVSRINLAILAGNGLLLAALWLFYSLVGLILVPSVMMTSYGWLFIGGLGCFSLAALEISFAVGQFIHNREVLSGVSNVIALGSSFLCGVFMPQEFLGETVLSFSRLLPTYWYVKGNNQIPELTNLGWSSIQPIVINFAIVVAFAIGIAIVAVGATRLLSLSRSHQKR